jgi:hypothetical protein
MRVDDIRANISKGTANELANEACCAKDGCPDSGDTGPVKARVNVDFIGTEGMDHFKC